jgi:hypothetical protein
MPKKAKTRKPAVKRPKKKAAVKRRPRKQDGGLFPLAFAIPALIAAGKAASLGAAGAAGAATVNAAIGSGLKIAGKRHGRGLKIAGGGLRLAGKPRARTQRGRGCTKKCKKKK